MVLKVLCLCMLRGVASIVFMYAPWCGKYCVYVCSVVWQVLCLCMLGGAVSIVFMYAPGCGKYCIYILYTYY